MVDKIQVAETEITTMKHHAADRYAYAIADVLCWLSGYEQGKGEDAQMPPNWRQLRQLKAELHNHAATLRGDEPEDLPF